jgi:hypothetical protein
MTLIPRLTWPGSSSWPDGSPSAYGYVFSTGLEEDAGWARQFLAAHDRIVRGG